MTDVDSFLRLQLALLRSRGLRATLALNRTMTSALLASRRPLRDGFYRLVTEADLRARRKSTRAFVFGSGYSLNDISPAEWAHIAEHNTVGFNAFVYEPWVRVDYHLVRGWAEGSDGNLADVVDDFLAALGDNPHYRNTVFVYQDDYTATFAHSLLARRGLRQGTAVFPYRTNQTTDLPTRELSDGLVHAMGTLCEAVNFAVCLGFEEIVLVGVDLYDSRYFWVAPDKTVAIDAKSGMRLVQDRTDRGQRYDEPHSTATNGVVALMRRWYADLSGRGIRLSIYNPQSLLADVMPVYDAPPLAARSQSR